MKFPFATSSFALCVVLLPLQHPSRAETPEPILYTLKFPAPEKHVAEVEAVFPTDKRSSLDLMMAVWSPGFYRVQDYARRVEGFTARSTDGARLDVEQPQKNRWRVQTRGGAKIVVSYLVTCSQMSVVSNYVGDDMAVLNGAPTFITLAERTARPHDVQLELAPKWKSSITGLDPAPDGRPNHYLAPDYDTLVDSPIVAGNPSLHAFEVDGSAHVLVDIGDMGKWDGEKAAQDLEKIVKENCRFWGVLPFKNYYFLNVFRRGGGGLEHKNSTLLSAGPARLTGPQAGVRWFSFVSHEYFHAFNVKRLRPVELGPFDYEHPPRTSSLWIAEGLTTYFGDLLVSRAGLATPEEYLGLMSTFIGQLQNTPGRLVQTLDQASLDVWTGGMSGISRMGGTTISYYVKGPVVGFLLDAKIRHVTGAKKSLDDVMRLAYKRYADERGFTPEQFRATTEEVAAIHLGAWFQRALASTEELDYTEALDWYGLRFAPPEEPAKKVSGESSQKVAVEPPKPAGQEPAKKTSEEAAKKTAAEPAKTTSDDARRRREAEMRKWKLELRPNATDVQKAHLRALLEPNGRW
jgi:predicted metalloprotease with PDZ domain